MTEIESMKHDDPLHSTLHQRGSFSYYLARRLGKAVQMGAQRAPLHLIQKYTRNAEEQYLALRFFYACLYRKLGRHEEVKTIGAHNYQPLTEEEQQKIIQLRLQNVPLKHIANQLNRHVSTIYYFCKRHQI